MTAVNIERASGFPSGQLFLQSIEVALAVLVQTYSLSMKARRPIKVGVATLVAVRISEDINLADTAGVRDLSSTHFSHSLKTLMRESPTNSCCNR